MSQPSEWLTAAAAACDRLVPPALNDAAERAERRRLVAVLVAAPFPLAGAAAQVFAAELGVALTLALMCALFGAAWFAVLLVAAGARSTVAGLSALAAGALAIGATLAAAGGLATPLALLLAALPFEAHWVCRSRRARGAGLAAAAVAAALALAWAGAAVAAASAWHWLVPLIYAASVWLRLERASAVAAGAEVPAPAVVEEALLDAVVLRMSPAGEVTGASERARALLGVAPEMLLGNGLFERVQVADRVPYLCALSQLRDGAATREVRLRLRPAPAETGGPAHHAPFVLTLMRGDDAGAVVALLRDDARVAGLEAELARASESAESSELAKSRFLAAVSHELRTPLNAILGFSDVLASEMFGPLGGERQREHVRLIREAGGHLLSVVNAILDASKIESGTYELKPEPFRFAEAVELCLSLSAGRAAEKGIALTSDVDEALAEVTCDRRALQQVLINLLSNAVKFTPAGGSVTLSARRSGRMLEFCVADDGIGIAAADLEHIGKPFMQVENDYTRRYEGTGLGLAVVKGLVELQGGAMTIDSAPGEGTAVTIRLPLADAAADGDGTAAGRPVALHNSEWIDEPQRKTA
ncbi:PAS domain-containing sensor histidine kinase [Aquibium sp. A9E412]|uniref:sensor histidine kinase n=1 Tax=Aquibium sp. A9E412 TaxID=2976767 RepID=UPI0025B06041|nr:PAS domain-containing sensor histidine kinase [Aquibium sp. A9E412]MDN2566355.1 PAS domain-containing sensor histidine kinase [Aquibium sp. A9E412]